MKYLLKETITRTLLIDDANFPEGITKTFPKGSEILRILNPYEDGYECLIEDSNGTPCHVEVASNLILEFEFFEPTDYSHE